jgi:hypothetical protein
MTMIRAAGALFALALGGCAMMQPEEKLPPPAQPEALGVELTKQQGGRFIAFVAPRQQHAEMFLGVSDTNFFTLRSWLDTRNNEAAHQLYVADSFFGGPFKWDAAIDQDKTTLRFVDISHNQISCEEGCSYADEFAAALPEDYLRAHRNGFTVTFSAKEGKTLSVTVPPTMVRAELAAVDTVRATLAKTAANAPAPTTTPPATTPAPIVIPAATPAAASTSAPATGIKPGTVVPAPPR